MDLPKSSFQLDDQKLRPVRGVLGGRVSSLAEIRFMFLGVFENVTRGDVFPVGDVMGQGPFQVSPLCSTSCKR